MTILITGANGQLGNELRIASLKSEDRFVFTDITEAREEQCAMLRKLAGDSVPVDTEILDITDIDAIRGIIRRENVGVIVNCAAFTDVEGAEDRQELAEKLNATAPENLAVAISEVGGTLFHVSTMCSEQSLTMSLAGRTRRADLQECMALPNCMARRKSWRPAAITS